MKKETWNLIEEFFADSPTLKAEPVSYKVIDEEFSQNSFTIPSDYREFIHRYGGAILGAYSVYGIGSCKLMGNDSDSVFKVTDSFKVQGWPGVEGWLVVSVDSAGNPVGMDTDGKIWVSDAVHGCIDELADSFEEYVLEWCLDFEDEED